VFSNVGNVDQILLASRGFGENMSSFMLPRIPKFPLFWRFMCLGHESCNVFFFFEILFKLERMVGFRFSHKVSAMASQVLKENP
jgi:hypothetical protein